MGAFYVSAVLQKDDSGVKKFLDGMPFACPKLLSKVAEHDDGVWLFLGGNPPADAPSKVIVRHAPLLPAHLFTSPSVPNFSPSLSFSLCTFGARL